MKKFLKFLKFQKNVDKHECLLYNMSCVTSDAEMNIVNYGVWLSLARAPGLGPGGRGFESCHPDSAGVVQW